MIPGITTPYIALSLVTSIMPRSFSGKETIAPLFLPSRIETKSSVFPGELVITSWKRGNWLENIIFHDSGINGTSAARVKMDGQLGKSLD